MKKRYFLLIFSASVLISFTIARSVNASKEETVVVPESNKTPNYLSYKEMTLDLGYTKIYADPVFDNLHMPGHVGIFGVGGDVNKFARALRFKNITDAVEDRYNLPRGIIFSMMVEESTGADLLPNGLGDGGFGLCHMQPAVARDFSLKTYKNCKGMVCNGKDKRSCVVNGKKQNHAKDLKDLIEKNHFDRKLVIKYDDRLHPIKNLDAVGRMLASYMDGPRIDGLGPFRTAICRYAGKYNYQSYWKDVSKNMQLLENKAFMQKVEDNFNQKNKNLIINGEGGDWDIYLKISQQQNYNYGLEEYKNLPKFEPKNSIIVKKTYRDFM